MNHYVVMMLSKHQQEESLKAATRDELVRIAQEDRTADHKAWRIRLPLHLFVIEIYRPQHTPIRSPQ
jgi:hypothetical protein